MRLALLRRLSEALSVAIQQVIASPMRSTTASFPSERRRSLNKELKCHWSSCLPSSAPNLQVLSSRRVQDTTSRRRASHKSKPRWKLSTALSWRCCRRKSSRWQWRRTKTRRIGIQWIFQSSTAMEQSSSRIPEKGSSKFSWKTWKHVATTKTANKKRKRNEI